VQRRKQGLLAQRIDPVRRGRHTAPEAAAIQAAARQQTFQIRRFPRYILSRPGSFKSAEKPALSPNSGGSPQFVGTQ
jgi:hypothetical protein